MEHRWLRRHNDPPHAFPQVRHIEVHQQPDLVPRFVIPFLESLPFGDAAMKS
jgi:hypothetical protein